MSKAKPPQRVIHRIFERIEKRPDGGCWVWPGATASGYGRIAWREDGEAHWAAVHRVVWQELRGEIPEGADLDHLCHDPSQCAAAKECPHRKCCNPDHLEPVSRKENLARGGTIPAANAVTTHCPAGHPYEGDNVFKDKEGRRYCRECVRARNRAYYHANKERRREYNREWRQRNIGIKRST